MWRFIRPDATRVWNDSETLRRLSRYRAIIDNERVAKYLLAKELECSIELTADLDLLWAEHARLSKEFKSYLAKIDSGQTSRNDSDSVEVSYLDLKSEIALRILSKCHFCEHRCGVDRTQDKKGWCKLGSESRVNSAFLHTGEEAPLVPSGTIFFSSCCLACAFCQNYDISTNPNAGVIVDAKSLAGYAEALFRDGALNINYVGGDPVPNTHTIIGSMLHQTSNVTQLWNSSMYCSEETMLLLQDVIDVWLPDFKYGNNECAERLSKVKNYFDVVSRNHIMAYESGEVIVRHLVLPNHLECCTFPILEWVAENMPHCMVNIMGQYRPQHRVTREREKYSDITRGVSREEMRAAFDRADELGICWKPVS